MINSLGFDISHWNGFFDWEKAKDAGMQFAFFKATEGTTFVDDQLYNNEHGAQQVLIPYAVYHWFHPWADALLQADWFCKQVPACAQFPHIVDIEDKRSIPVNYAARVLRFLLRVEELTGHKPMIYTGYHYWRQYLGDLPWARDYRLIIANYRQDAPLIPLPWGPGQWSFWQFTDKARGYAYGSHSSYIDLDVSNGPYTDYLISS